MRIRLPAILVLGVPLLCLFTVVAYNLPPIHDNLAWRVDDLRSKIKYALNPPEQVVFVPQESAATKPPNPSPGPTNTPNLPSSTPTAPGPTTTPQPSPTPTLTPTSIPPATKLSGFAHIYQNYNNCGPATLAMALSYWKWPPDLANYLDNQDTRRRLQSTPAAYLKPIQDDKNVMPYEMETFI